MSTRAHVQFSDKWDTFFVYRHSDGYPESVMSDLESAIQGAAGTFPNGLRVLRRAFGAFASKRWSAAVNAFAFSASLLFPFSA